MTPSQIAAVRASFAIVNAAGPKAGTLFYEKLIEARPWLRAFFVDVEMTKQGARLTQMLGVAIGLLDRPSALRLVLHDLGARHAGYGVQPAYYAAGGAALAATLGDILGPAFTPGVEDAWRAFYEIVSTEMRHAVDAVLA